MDQRQVIHPCGVRERRRRYRASTSRRLVACIISGSGADTVCALVVIRGCVICLSLSTVTAGPRLPELAGCPREDRLLLAVIRYRSNPHIAVAIATATAQMGPLHSDSGYVIGVVAPAMACPGATPGR